MSELTEFVGLSKYCANILKILSSYEHMTYEKINDYYYVFHLTHINVNVIIHNDMVYMFSCGKKLLNEVLDTDDVVFCNVHDVVNSYDCTEFWIYHASTFNSNGDVIIKTTYTNFNKNYYIINFYSVILYHMLSFCRIRRRRGGRQRSGRLRGGVLLPRERTSLPIAVDMTLKFNS